MSIQAWRADKTGDPAEVLQLAPLSRPALQGDEVRVRMRAASVSFADLLMVSGRYQTVPEAPFVPGLEFAGEVVEIGRESKIGVGSRIMAVTAFPQSQDGAFAEEVVVRESDVFVIPDGVSFSQAAALSVAYVTAHLALHEIGGASAGDQVVVLGAAGGVGVAALQLAKLSGARSIAVVDNSKTQWCSRLGVEVVLDADSPTMQNDLMDATGGLGADVVVDTVGGDVAQQAMRAMRYGGRVAIVGFTSGSIGVVKTNRLLLAGTSVRGVNRELFRINRSADFRRLHEKLLGMVATGTLVPTLGREYEFNELPLAFADIAARRTRGRSILRGPSERAGWGMQVDPAPVEQSARTTP